MSLLETIKQILGIKPINIGELNRRATRQMDRPNVKTTLKDPLDGVTITDEYKTIRALLEEGSQSVFVTGNAGTGKTMLIRYLRSVLDRKIVVVAPTGVAALNIEGATIHSFFHLPSKIHEESDIKLLYRKLYQKLEVLIIDEVSMVRCDLMDSIDKFLRKNRSSHDPFGGVQLLMVGDLYQLPPVAKKHEWDVLRPMGYASPYFFSSFSLQDTSLLPIVLTRIFRQKDQFFIEILNSIRTGENLDFAIAEVNKRCYRKDDFLADITLTCTNNKADQINRKQLEALQAREYEFKGEFWGKIPRDEENLPSPINLTLKCGARVMFTKNDERRRWVNGTLGIIRKIDERSISVELLGDLRAEFCDVLKVTWEKYEYDYDPEQDKIVARVVGRYTQYPLMLAWAVTIHKSQGKTFDKVFIDFGNGAFASGQVYTALSRCPSIDGIRLSRPIRRTDVKYDPLIKRFYDGMEEMKKETEGEQPAAADDQ